MNDSILRFDGVSKIYKTGDLETTGLDSVSAHFTRGELTALVGPSGSGKSTMQHLGAGFDSATKGSVYLMGMDITRYKERELTRLRNRHIGFIFQSFNLIPVMSAYENAVYPAGVFGKPYRFDGSARDRAMHLLERVGIASQANKKPHQMSGGQRQRVAIARALMNAPELIFADEPTANLDHATGREILDLLVSLNEETGTTILFSTHDEAVMTRARRIIRLSDGRIKEDSACVQS